MKQTIVIRSQPDKERAKRIIDNMPIDTPHLVKIGPETRKKSDIQRALYFVQVDHFASQTGESPESLHRQLKGMHLLPILVRDDEAYAAVYHATVDALQRGGGDEAVRGLIGMTSITRANVKQMNEYMEKVKHEAAGLGIALPVPDDLRWA